MDHGQDSGPGGSLMFKFKLEHKIASQVGLKNNCTFCGVFRRQALDRGAMQVVRHPLMTTVNLTFSSIRSSQRNHLLQMHHQWPKIL